MRWLKFVRAGAYVAFLFAVVSLLLFSALEFAPELRSRIDLSSIRYYGIQATYTPDPQLIFIPNGRDYTQKIAMKGDLYSARYGFDVPTIDYQATYEGGFRKNLNPPPFEIFVIGDSYIEMGERDDDTLSERVASELGVSTYNLGRGWYGPHHYVELFRRHAKEHTPRYALFCFFSGNDIRDIGQYLAWQDGGSYYDFSPTQGNFFQRYLLVMSDAKRVARNWYKGRRRQVVASVTEDWEKSIHHKIGMIALGDRSVPMRFTYEPAAQTPTEQLETREWQVLRELIGEFRDVARASDVQPVLLYIPTKFEIYAPYATPESGETLLDEAATLAPFNGNSAESLGRIASELGIPLVDLYPEYRRRAATGELLYYPFDSHWNSAGRRAAAEFVAARWTSVGSGSAISLP